MASPFVFQQVSTPENSKRKASGVPLSTPPRKAMPASNAKLDALGHCYEGELAKDQRKPLHRGGTEHLIAMKGNESAKRRRTNKFDPDALGTSRDAVMANMRLLHEAHQRLVGSSRDQSVRYGKEKLSLGETLPIFDDLSKLLQEKAETPVADLDESNAILVQRDDLLKENDRLIDQMKAARQERDRYRQERDLYLQQRNSMEQKRDILLLEMLKRERDKLQEEIEQYQQQSLEEKAAKESIEAGAVPQRVLNEAHREKDEPRTGSARYRQERDKINDLELVAVKKKQMSKEAAARGQETIYKLVVAIAILRSSYNDMLSAFIGRGRVINSHIVHSQSLNERLTDNQEVTATLQAGQNQLQAAHADCERNQRLQLGRADRKTLFDDFSEFAQSLSGKGLVFKGQEGDRDVDVSFCVLPGSDEGLCVIRRLGDAFTIWHSKMEDCSIFIYAWHPWLCLGGKDQGKPLYICLDVPRESAHWLRKYIAKRTVSEEERDVYKQTKHF